MKELSLAYDAKEEELDLKINKKSFTLLPSCVPVKVFVSTQEKRGRKQQLRKYEKNEAIKSMRYFCLVPSARCEI